jgi:hypothetical protein
MNAKEIEIRKQYLFNEIVNVAPATQSPFYIKNIRANERMAQLKKEFDQFITLLQQVDNKSDS